MMSAPHDPRILVEQLRVVHVNGLWSILAAGTMSCVLVWVLARSGNVALLVLWSASTWLYLVVARRLIAPFARSSQPQADAPRAARLDGVLFSCYGLLWGALPWLTFDRANPMEIALVICALAGIMAGAVGFMAPVWRVFAGFASCVALPSAAKLMLMGPTEYVALGVCALLYAGALIGQARQASRSVRRLITLRFENAELVERLRTESANAQAARDQAEAANQAKSKFLAAASHDLRQPIHALGLFLEVLERSALNPQQREVLANARAACVASGEMLNTLLDFSRIEAGVVAPQVKAFALQPLLNQLEIELAEQANRKGIVYRSRDTQAIVHSDPALIALILRNLIANAIRYTDQGGVLVAVRQRQTTWVVEVWDTGIGIPAAHQQAVFREFHQLGNPERDRRKGLGLGLAIAKGLAATLGHPLTLASRVGRGSVFRLHLTASDSGAQPQEALPDLVSKQPPSEIGESDQGVAHILVIDDDDSTRAAMAALLRGWGYTCDTAESIGEAVALARAHAPDLVMSDYRLRERRTGAEAIRAVRTALENAALPALLITGDTAPERLREAQSTGVPLLHKPVAPSELHKCMMALLR